VAAAEPDEYLRDRVKALMWQPVYRPLRPV
jgi:hypothetical protein